jgi:accessory secretory protein Asp1
MITDSPENSMKIIRQIGVDARVVDITPYDSRVDFGISQQVPVQKILVPVDDLATDVFEELIGELCKCLLANEHARVHLFTRQADYNRRARLEAQVRMWLQEMGYDERWCMDELPAGAGENNVDEENPVHRLFFVEQCVDELSVSRCMREQRILVDMREIPELYLQITSISMGIPQLVRSQTEFIRDGKNGFIVRDMRQIPERVSYYLDSLENWNEALVSSYELGKKFTTEKLLEQWKEVIDCVG